MTRAFRNVFVCFLIASGCGGCSHEEEEPIEPIPPPELTAEEVDDLVELREAPLAELLDRLDRDGDGVVGRADVEAIADCIDGEFDRDCDINRDGELTTEDLVLMRTMVGWQEPRSEAVRALTAEALVSLADGDGPLGEDQIPLFDDYNGDGDIDVDDVRMLGEQLGDDPAGRLDRDDDGILGLPDVWAYAREYAATYVNEPSDTDINGNGELDTGDIALVSGLAALSTKTHGGYLDLNFDGVIDEGDYCQRSDHAGIPNFYASLLPAEEADAAFAADSPELMLCRTDGKQLLRYPAQLDSQVDYVLRPGSLYLAEASEVPAGYDVELTGAVGDGPFFIVTTDETDHPITELRIGWALDTGGAPSLSLEAGDDVPAGAVLLMPAGSAGLEAGPLNPAALTKIHRTALPGMTELEKTKYNEFKTKFEELKAKYEAKLAECEKLPPTEATEVLRFLYAYRESLHQLQAHARFRLSVLEAQHKQNLSAHVAEMNASAIRWSYMDDMIMELAGFEVGMLMVEIAEGGSKGGLPGALVTATKKLVEELAFKDDKLPVYLTGEGDVVSDMLDGLVSGEVLEQVGVYVDSSTQEKVAAWAGDGSVVGEIQNIYSRLFGDADGFPNAWAIKDALGQVFKLISSAFEVPDDAPTSVKVQLKNAVTGIATNVLKNFPKMLVNFAIRQSLAADLGATANAQAFDASALRVGAWRGALNVLVEAESDMNDVLTAYNMKYGALGGAQLQSCRTALTENVDSAEDAYAASERAAKMAMQLIETEQFGRDSDFVADCFDGDSAKAFESLMLRQSVMGHYVDVAAIDDAGSILGALEGLAGAVKDMVVGTEEYEQTCSERLEAYEIPPDAMSAYQGHLDAIFDARSELADIRDDAWTDFEVCVGAGPGSFRPPFFDDVIWENARLPLDTAPSDFSCPIIRSLSPSTGAQGSTVKLTGDGLGDSTTWGEFEFMFLADDGRERLTVLAQTTQEDGAPSLLVPNSAEPGQWNIVATRASDGVVMVSPQKAETRFEVTPSVSKIIADSRRMFLVDPSGVEPPLDIVPEANYAGRTFPTWSPDYTKIAYTQEGTPNTLEVADASGTSLFSLPAPATQVFSHPTFSRDGTSIAVAVSENSGEIWTLNADGTNVQVALTRLHPTAFHAPGNLVFSPDGSQVAAIIYQITEALLDEVLVTVEVGSTNVVQNVLAGTNVLPMSYNYFNSEYEVRWTQANELVFMNEVWDVMAVDPTTQSVRNLMPDDQVFGMRDVNTYALSPDEQWLAYRDGVVDYNDIRLIEVANPANNTLLIDNSGNLDGTCIAWSPTGREIAYIEDYQIWVYNLDTQMKRMVHDDSVGGDDSLSCIHWAL